MVCLQLNSTSTHYESFLGHFHGSWQQTWKPQNTYCMPCLLGAQGGIQQDLGLTTAALDVRGVTGGQVPGKDLAIFPLLYCRALGG